MVEPVTDLLSSPIFDLALGGVGVAIVWRAIHAANQRYQRTTVETDERLNRAYERINELESQVRELTARLVELATKTAEAPALTLKNYIATPATVETIEETEDLDK